MLPWAWPGGLGHAGQGLAWSDSGVLLCLAPPSSALALRGGYQSREADRCSARERLPPPSCPADLPHSPTLNLAPAVHLLARQVSSGKAEPQRRESRLCHCMVCAIFTQAPQCFSSERSLLTSWTGRRQRRPRCQFRVFREWLLLSSASEGSPPFPESGPHLWRALVTCGICTGLCELPR